MPIRMMQAAERCVEQAALDRRAEVAGGDDSRDGAGGCAVAAGPDVQYDPGGARLSVVWARCRSRFAAGRTAKGTAKAHFSWGGATKRALRYWVWLTR